MQDRTDPPASRDIRGDLICTQCARVAGHIQGPSTRRRDTVTFQVEDPSHADMVRRLCCPHCGGRLWLQNSAEVPIDPLAFDPAALRPRRGRPLKTSKPS
jgi:hypothetical protein